MRERFTFLSFILRALAIGGVSLAFPLATSFAQAENKYEIIDFPPPTNKMMVTTLLKIERQGYPTLEVGYGDVKKGAHLPIEGSVSLPVDDIGIMIEGRQTVYVDNMPADLRARQLVHVFPFMAQSAFYVEPTKLVFLFFGDPVEDPAVPKPQADMENKPQTKVWSAAELAEISQPQGAAALPLLKVDDVGNPTLEIVLAQIPAGTVTPDAGDTSYSGHYMEIVLKGKLVATIGGKEMVLQAGDIVRIPPNMPHSAHILEDTELAYVFYGRDASVLATNK